MGNEDQSAQDKTSIMTLHAAKGLEFATIFLPGWEEGIFPNQLSMDDHGVAGLEEERRLAYVGLTRAKTKAFILYAASRQVFGQWQNPLPSRFIEELPDAYIERRSSLYQGAGSASGLRHEPVDWAVSPKGYGAGWRRAYNKSETLAERRAKSKTIDGSARRIRPSETITCDFAIGERVFHEKFGYGLIEDVDGDKLDVNFETSGLKRIVDSFVRPA